MPNDLLLTTVVGSYPQPEWLIDRTALGNRLPPRVRAQELWRIPAEFLEEAQNDATVVAIRDMAAAGIDIISDGEQGARATPTTLPIHWRAWTYITQAPHWDAQAVPTQCPAWQAPYVASARKLLKT